jgi:hypothetical protein
MINFCREFFAADCFVGQRSGGVVVRLKDIPLGTASILRIRVATEKGAAQESRQKLSISHSYLIEDR